MRFARVLSRLPVSELEVGGCYGAGWRYPPESQRRLVTPQRGPRRGHGREIFEAFLTAIKSGDWRAADLIMTRVYGKPKETVEHQNSELDRLMAMTPEERDALRARLAERRARLNAVE
jgi:hypothetical protein